MADWLDAALDCRERSEPFVIVTVVAVRGSAPREVGARMLVTPTASVGTIGGGQLEFSSTALACELLGADAPVRPRERRIVLGTDCGQCCGGVVDVHFEAMTGDSPWLAAVAHRYRAGESFVLVSARRGERGRHIVTTTGAEPIEGGGSLPAAVMAAARQRLTAPAPALSLDDHVLEYIGFGGLNIAVFGAGHVGAALVDVLSRLDCRLRWIDSRRRVFPATLPDGVLPVPAAEPAREVLAMPAGAYYVIATHSHPADLEICAAVLRRQDFAYCGLIGSRSKRYRFRHRLRDRGIAADVVDRLTCPIGVAGIAGKNPAEIAVAVAAEILQRRDRQRAAVATPLEIPA
jgi:xanthine dehydrogenase accessory factor